VKGSVVIGKAAQILQDVDFERTSEEELLEWLNSAQRLLVLIRPDAKTQRGTIELVEGVHQTIPAAGLRLIKLVRNPSGRAVTLVSEEQLTDFDPGWYTATARDTVKHYLFDPLEPKSFDVYPPAEAGAEVLGVWSVLPTDLQSTDDDIDVDAIYEMPLIQLTCYCALLKDSEEEANRALAALHLEAATMALTGKTNADERTAPANNQPAKVRPALR
jgi:hypothetical protein